MSLRVLIVDDMMTMRKLVGKVCKEIGFTDLTEANDGIVNATNKPESSKRRLIMFNSIFRPELF